MPTISVIDVHGKPFLKQEGSYLSQYAESGATGQPCPLLIHTFVRLKELFGALIGGPRCFVYQAATDQPIMVALMLTKAVNLVSGQDVALLSAAACRSGPALDAIERPDGSLLSNVRFWSHYQLFGVAFSMAACVHNAPLLKRCWQEFVRPLEEIRWTYHTVSDQTIEPKKEEKDGHAVQENS